MCKLVDYEPERVRRWISVLLLRLLGDLVTVTRHLRDHTCEAQRWPQFRSRVRLRMEANTPPDLVKQPLVMERRGKSEKKELMEEVGRIETFRLEEAFLNACRDGNLPVVRLCLEHR